jgi:hypothetical protein
MRIRLDWQRQVGKIRVGEWQLTRAITAIVAAITLVFGGACSLLGGSVSVEYDEHLSQRLRELSAEAGTARLSDLTDFEWDVVHVFFEGATAEEVERVVGVPVLSDKRYYTAGNLLVFVADGEVVAARSVVPDLLAAGGEFTFDNTTILEPRGGPR